MNHRFSVALFCVCGILAVLARPASGGGPLLVNNAATPRPIIWREPVSPFNPASSIPFNPDRGPLGSQSEAQAVAAVTEMCAVWENIPTALPRFSNEGSLPVDVNSGNYTTYLDDWDDDINPIIFDADGTIHDALFGVNNSVLGFAGFAAFTSIASVAEGQAVLNGRFVDGNAGNGEVANFDVFKGTILHEIGHYCGLDHTQVNNLEAFDGVTTNDNAVPTMYPINVFQAASSQERLTPNADDIQTFSSLYPDTTFAAGYGKLAGTVFGPDGQPVQGVNVVARSVADPLRTACSCVSGFLFQEQRNGVPDENFGTTNTDYRGTFEIAVPPGNYKLEIDSVQQRFNGGSSVGPLSPPIHAGPPESWNGYLEGNRFETDNPTEATTIAVAAGQTVSKLDFTVNYSTGMYEVASGATSDLAGTQVTFTPDFTARGGYRVRFVSGVSSFPIDPSGHAALSLANDGFATLNAPLSVYSPFFGNTNLSCNVSANGLITFGSPGAAETDTTPTLSEFFSGNAKLAPFWSDLNPNAAEGGGGAVRTQFFTTGLCITYDRVVGRNPAETFNCQVFINESGVITFTYLTSNVAGLRMIGISSGGTYLASPTLQRDFSALGSDTVAPSLSITNPADRSKVSGSTAVFSAITSDGAPSSGAPFMTFYIDGLLVAESVGSVTWDTTQYSNGEHRLSVVSRDGAGNRAEASVTVEVHNDLGVKITQRLYNYQYTAPTLTCTLEIKNESSANLTNVNLHQIYLEVTGSFTGVQRVFGGPANGLPLPQLVSTSIPPGGTINVPLVFGIPTGGNQVMRWVDHGSCDQALHF